MVEHVVNQKVVFKGKLKAAIIHALVTIFSAIVFNFLIFHLWFPGGFADLLRGVELYWLIILGEVCLGPLMSLIVYNPSKSRRHLLMDYCVIGAIQVSALVYGSYILSGSRPVFVVFVKDSFEAVTPSELEKVDLNAAAKEYQSFGMLGPKVVCSEGPKDPHEKSTLLFSALDGKDIQLFPKYYRPCRAGEIEEAYLDKSMLLEIIQPRVDATKLKNMLPEGEFVWMPVKSRFGAAVQIKQKDELTILNIDPYP